MDANLMLEADRKRLRRWLQNEGVVMCEDPEVLALARPVLMAIAETFPAYIPDCVQDFYVYRCSEQPEGLQSMDGINWKNCINTVLLLKLWKLLSCHSKKESRKSLSMRRNLAG